MEFPSEAHLKTEWRSWPRKMCDRHNYSWNSRGEENTHLWSLNLDDSLERHLIHRSPMDLVIWERVFFHTWTRSPSRGVFIRCCPRLSTSCSHKWEDTERESLGLRIPRYFQRNSNWCPAGYKGSSKDHLNSRFSSHLSIKLACSGSCALPISTATSMCWSSCPSPFNCLNMFLGQPFANSI